MGVLTIKFDDTLDERILTAYNCSSLDELQEVVGGQLVEQTKDFEVKQTELAEDEKRKLAEDASRQIIEAKIIAVADEVKLATISNVKADVVSEK